MTNDTMGPTGTTEREPDPRLVEMIELLEDNLAVQEWHTAHLERRMDRLEPWVLAIVIAATTQAVLIAILIWKIS